MKHESEVYSTTKHGEQARPIAMLRARELRASGAQFVKVKKVGFQDLARCDSWFVTWVEGD